MTVWQAILHQLGVLIQKIGAPLFAFLAGLSAGKDKAEDKARKQADKARSEQDEKDAEFNRRIRDADRRKRLRDALEKTGADD